MDDWQGRSPEVYILPVHKAEKASVRSALLLARRFPRPDVGHFGPVQVVEVLVDLLPFVVQERAAPTKPLENGRSLLLGKLLQGHQKWLAIYGLYLTSITRAV